MRRGGDPAAFGRHRKGRRLDLSDADSVVSAASTISSIGIRAGPRFISSEQAEAGARIAVIEEEGSAVRCWLQRVSALMADAYEISARRPRHEAVTRATGTEDGKVETVREPLQAQRQELIAIAQLELRATIMEIERCIRLVVDIASAAEKSGAYSMDTEALSAMEGVDEEDSVPEARGSGIVSDVDRLNDMGCQVWVKDDHTVSCKEGSTWVERFDFASEIERAGSSMQRFLENLLEQVKVAWRAHERARAVHLNLSREDVDVGAVFKCLEHHAKLKGVCSLCQCVDEDSDGNGPMAKIQDQIDKLNRETKETVTTVVFEIFNTSVRWKRDDRSFVSPLQVYNHINGCNRRPGFVAEELARTTLHIAQHLVNNDMAVFMAAPDGKTTTSVSKDSVKLFVEVLRAFTSLTGSSKMSSAALSAATGVSKKAGKLVAGSAARKARYASKDPTKRADLVRSAD